MCRRYLSQGIRFTVQGVGRRCRHARPSWLEAPESTLRHFSDILHSVAWPQANNHEQTADKPKPGQRVNELTRSHQMHQGHNRWKKKKKKRLRTCQRAELFRETQQEIQSGFPDRILEQKMDGEGSLSQRRISVNHVTSLVISWSW